MLALGQRQKWLVAVAYLDGGGAFAGVPHARIVAGAAHGGRRVLWQFAVEVIGGVDDGGVGG